jgi:hypothetical protein
MDLTTTQLMEILLSLALGIGLSAACGFRIFVPFLAMSIAAQSGHLTLADGWAWIGSVPALVAFGVAACVEIGAYYVPWLDNLLDTIATPVAVVAGIIATAAVVSGMSPLLTWTLAVIAGGGAAGVMQTGTVLLRAMSSTTTLGAGNFVVATGEATGAVAFSLLAFLLPIITLLLVLQLVIWIWRRSRTKPSVALKQP